MTVSSVYVGLVTMETRSSAAVSSFSPKVHLGDGVGYPVMGTLMLRACGTITSSPFLKALRSKAGPAANKVAVVQALSLPSTLKSLHH